MTTLRPFVTARESVLTLWPPSAQLRRSSSEAHVLDLFILLHGMIFADIQLDDFQCTLSRLLEHLQTEVIEERDWMMMAVVNIGSILEYGRPTAVLKWVSCIVPTIPPLPESRASSKKEERRDSDCTDIDAIPIHLRLPLQLTFSMFSQALSRPTRSISPRKDLLNPYVTIILTFVSVVVRDDHWSIIEPVIPWDELVFFLSTIPGPIIRLSDEAAGSKEPSIITAGCAALPEDACLRGMAWAGRRIYERGFWNRAVNRQINEPAVLDVRGGEEASNGTTEDDDSDDCGKRHPRDFNQQDNRLIRALRSGIRIAKYVDGFMYAEQPNGEWIWSVEGRLADKVESWKERRRGEHEEEEMRRTRHWDGSMGVDEEPVEAASGESGASRERE